MWGRRRNEIREPADVTGPGSDFAEDYALATRMGIEVAWAYDHGRDLTVVHPLSGQLVEVTYDDRGRRTGDRDRTVEALTAVASAMETGLSYDAAVELVTSNWER